MLKTWTYVVGAMMLAALGGYAIYDSGPHYSNDEMKAKLEATQLKFFIDQTHPVTGQVRDAAQEFEDTPESNRMSSVAATGFGLAVIANASERGMLDRTFARDYCRKSILFAKNHVERRKGWFLHFVDWETGGKIGDVEYSTIDTALFMAGAMYAAQVLNDDELKKAVHQLYEEEDYYDALTDGGALPFKKTLSMAWAPGAGYTKQQWDMYAEERLLLLMGLGHPTHPLPASAWSEFPRKEETVNVAGGLHMMGVDYALFTHQYSDLFLDFREFHDGYVNYFENGIKATRLHRELAREEQDNATVRAGFWGYSAGTSPDNHGYEAWSPYHHRGIVCLGCAMGSAMFLPNDVLGDAAKWLSGPYRDTIWGRYGFVDSIDLERNWMADHVYGITVGPIFLSLANLHEETSVWKDFMKIPEMEVALSRASSPVMAAKAGGQTRTPASEK